MQGDAMLRVLLGLKRFEIRDVHFVFTMEHRIAFVAVKVYIGRSWIEAREEERRWPSASPPGG